MVAHRPRAWIVSGVPWLTLSRAGPPPTVRPRNRACRDRDVCDHRELDVGAKGGGQQARVRECYVCRRGYRRWLSHRSRRRVAGSRSRAPATQGSCASAARQMREGHPSQRVAEAHGEQSGPVRAIDTGQRARRDCGQRYTSTGIVLWMRTLWVSLPNSSPRMPRRPWEAITMRSQPIWLAVLMIASKDDRW